MFQAEGTVVSTQDTATYKVSKVQDLYDVPLQLSIALDSTQQASGLYYLEVGPISAYAFEYGSIQVSANNISFTPSNNPLNSTLNITILEKVSVHLVQANVNASCAMLRNGTAFALYTSTYELEGERYFTVQPKYIADPDTPTVIRIPELSYIAYGEAQPGQEVATLCSPKKLQFLQ